MSGRPEIEDLNVTLIGAFNPAIMTPGWLAARNLLPDGEATAAKVEVIHPQVASFSTDWLRFQVTNERFLASTAQASMHEPLRDLVLSIFGLLRFTPVQKMGINRQLHYPMPSLEAWNALGDRLAPKEPWAALMTRPGMRGLTMEEARETPKGYVRVTVEPSVRIHPGVFVAVNDHYEVSDPEATEGCDEILHILRSRWDDSLGRSLRIAEALVSST